MESFLCLQSGDFTTRVKPVVVHFVYVAVLDHGISRDRGRGKGLLQNVLLGDLGVHEVVIKVDHAMSCHKEEYQ